MSIFALPRRGAFLRWAVLTLAFLTPAFGTTGARAQAVGASYSSPTSGTLNGIAFTVSGYSSGQTLSSIDLSGSDYSGAPLSASQQIVIYSVRDSLTFTFASPVSNLLFYEVFFRGSGAGVTNPTYTFTTPFTILSGNFGATVTGGNTLNVTSSSFYSGILQFTGPVSSLTLSTNATGLSAQAFTLGTSIAAVPEPSPLVTAGVVVAAGLAAGRRRRSRRS